MLMSTFMWILAVEHMNINSWLVLPLQSKRAQQDDMIKRASVTPQTVENNVETMMEIWHLGRFQVFIFDRLQLLIAPHRSEVFICCCFLSLQWSRVTHNTHASCLSWFDRSVSFALCRDTSTFSPQSIVKPFFAIIGLYPLRFVFSTNWRCSWK